MAAAPLPAARQITLPLGAGGKCGASTTSGCAAATAASKIARRRGRWSVIVPGRLEGKASGSLYLSPLPKRKPPQADLAGVYRMCVKGSAADVAGNDVAEQLPLLALEPHQLKLADRSEIGGPGVDVDPGQQHLGTKV